MEYFPVEVNRAPYETLLRVPGIGVISAKRIMVARRVHSLAAEDLSKLGVVMKRARHFLTCSGHYAGSYDLRPDVLSRVLSNKTTQKNLLGTGVTQLAIDFNNLTNTAETSYSVISGHL